MNGEMNEWGGGNGVWTDCWVGRSVNEYLNN